jgi:CubicO group peptidase (beta-lactamase class C family)
VAGRVAVALVVLVASVIVTLAPWPQLPPTALDDDAQAMAIAQVAAPQSIDELRARIAEVLAREKVPGVGIALIGRDGPIWIGGVGIADLKTGTPVDEHTVFRVASITKMVVALGVMKLVDQGKLDLDRPLRDYIPDAGIDNPWEAESPVTLGEVLEHTAGLDDMHPNETFGNDDAMSPSAALTLNPRSRVIRWRPGTRHAYSNVGYTLAARAIEVATGEPFDTWLRREILAPIGMRDADFRRTDTLKAHLAVGYVEPDRASPFRPIPHRGAGALLASPAEMAKLVELFLRRPPLISAASFDRIERTGTLPYPRLDVGYGLGNYGDVSQPARARGHDGGLPGFLSALRYFPDQGVGYVMLLNGMWSPAAYLEIRALLFAYLTRGRTFSAPAAAPAPPPEAAYYSFASPRHGLFGFLDRALLGWHVTTHDDRVHIEPNIFPGSDLVATPDGAYRLPRESGSSITFTRSRDGTPVIHDHLAYGEASSWLRVRGVINVLGFSVTFLRFAPVWLAIALVFVALGLRRLVALDLMVCPALAYMLFASLPRLLTEAALREVLGECNVWTIGFCAVSIAFASCAFAGVIAAVRWQLRPDRPPLRTRLYPSIAAVIAACLAMWLGVHGIIGLTFWTW